MSKLLLQLGDTKDVRAALGVCLLHPLLLLLYVLVQLLRQRGELEVAGDVVLHVRPGRKINFHKQYNSFFSDKNLT